LLYESGRTSDFSKLQTVQVSSNKQGSALAMKRRID